MKDTLPIQSVYSQSNQFSLGGISRLATNRSPVAPSLKDGATLMVNMVSVRSYGCLFGYFLISKILLDFRNFKTKMFFRLFSVTLTLNPTPPLPPTPPDFCGCLQIRLDTNFGPPHVPPSGTPGKFSSVHLTVHLYTFLSHYLSLSLYVLINLSLCLPT